ncbi:hypothetical protein [Anabaena sp. CCY 9910]|uniref:hypothetical protein n=1 Tax=Anabaena sp. CCY 9910 TaxID=3103870 RepID=UPI0039E0EE21
MNHFNSKSLVFYGVAITSVLILFKIVTLYGEKNLQASPVLNNSYRLTWKNNVLNCEKSAPMMLNIQQSGIYLNAALFSAGEAKPLAMSGIWKNQQMSLAGKIDQPTLCNITVPQSVKMQMQLTDKGNLQGQLIISDISQTLEFNATPEAAQVRPENSRSH